MIQILQLVNKKQTATYIIAGIISLAATALSPAVHALTSSNGDFEAETITNLSSKNIKPYNDSSASASKALQFYVNGTATRSTSLPVDMELKVFARGVPCNGDPVMAVSVDGNEVSRTSVSNNTYLGYSASVALTSGVHSITIALTNDYYLSPSCDRNLIVDKIEFTPTEEITVPPPPPPACPSTAPQPTNADPGTEVIADGFESNDFSKWTRIAREGDATAEVQSTNVKNDSCAAKIHVTANSGSRANISKTLPSLSREIWATGWFNITRQGASTSSNVPTFRFFNGTTRILDVSRQNGSGAFFVRYPSATGSTIISTGRTLNVNQWYQIKVHAVANGQQSQVEVWLDGAKVFDRTNSTTGYATFGNFTSVTSLMVGAEHVLQDGDFVTDDIVAKVLQ